MTVSGSTSADRVTHTPLKLTPSLSAPQYPAQLSVEPTSLQTTCPEPACSCACPYGRMDPPALGLSQRLWVCPDGSGSVPDGPGSVLTATVDSPAVDPPALGLSRLPWVCLDGRRGLASPGSIPTATTDLPECLTPGIQCLLTN